MLSKLYKLYLNNYHFLYVLFLSIFVAGMPHSRALLSSSLIALAIFWFLDINIKQKLNKLLQNRAVLIFISIYFLHIVGLIFTSNFSYAFHDLKIKLPLLLFPIVIGTSKLLVIKEVKLLVSIFTLSVFVKTIFGFAVLNGISGKEIQNLQEISGNFSHVRYSLMLNFIIFTNVFFLFISKKQNEKLLYKIIRLFSILWFGVFLFLLHSVTGWVIFFVLILFTGFYFLFNSKSLFKKYGIIFSFGLSLIITVLLFLSVNKFYKTDIIDKNSVDILTQSGNYYWHNFDSENRENGHFVDIYISETELFNTWNKVSDYDYYGLDDRKQEIKYTLIRYLTSKNFRKDREGVMKLSKQDIINIEKGLANYIYENKYAIYPKIYEILWQIDKYIKGGNPERHSLTQRFEFFKIGKQIIKDNFWFGVGTGDVPDVFNSKYKTNASVLRGNYRLRAHNQYLTIFVTFGVFGFICFLFAYIYPGIKEKKFNNYLFLVSFIIMSLSMLNEDTLETQMGVTIFSFFITLFLFSSTDESFNS